MAACDCCTGTHYLNDVPDLGPCVCCTPENMQRRDRTIAALSAPKGPVELLDELESAIDGLRAYIAGLEMERDAAVAAKAPTV